MKFSLAKRFDAIGLFWQDAPPERRGGQKYARPMPPIPETGWRAPSYYPNIRTADVLSIDVEAYDPELDDYGPFWSRNKGHICGFSVGTQDGYRWYFPVRHTIQPETNLNPDHTFEWLRDMCNGVYRNYVGANLIYDVGALRTEGVVLDGTFVDVQFAEALLDEYGEINLEYLAQKYLKEGKVTDVLKQWIMDFYDPPKMKWRREIYRSPPCLAGAYGEGDADLPIRIAPIVYQKLQAEALLEVFNMECALIPLLVDMRFAGVRVDLEKANELSKTLLERAELVQKQLNEMAKTEVSVNSAVSLAEAFDAAGLSYPLTDSASPKPSFTKSFLKSVDHPIAKSVIEIRRLLKMKNTFVDNYIIGAAAEDGKIHGSFHPLRGDEEGTRSGRFSGTCPNLQNLPIRDPELGKLIRSIFVPDTGHIRWRKKDYSQIEYRGLVNFAVGPGADSARAKYCADPKTDYHKMTQALITEKTGEEMPRTRVKNVNFGLTYGMGPELLDSEYLHLGLAQTKAFLKAYHEGVPFAAPTMQMAMDQAAKYGVIATIMGRRSRFDLWEPIRTKRGEFNQALPYAEALQKYGRVKRAYTHKALNRLLQGSAADLMKMAMLICYQNGLFKKVGWPRITVHDELDFSDPGGLDAEFDQITYWMENAIKFRVPILVEEEIGSSWGTVEKPKKN